mmetsp:Transcript_37300/g.50474  ORF Transcript_37300/g.50474 Transcript_37300/m.50474 type:complete len:283 (+) Transcript_37300:788-1636(+)
MKLTSAPFISDATLLVVPSSAHARESVGGLSRCRWPDACCSLFAFGLSCSRSMDGTKSITAAVSPTGRGCMVEHSVVSLEESISDELPTPPCVGDNNSELALVSPKYFAGDARFAGKAPTSATVPKSRCAIVDGLQSYSTVGLPPAPPTTSDFLLSGCWLLVISSPLRVLSPLSSTVPSIKSFSWEEGSDAASRMPSFPALDSIVCIISMASSASCWALEVLGGSPGSPSTDGIGCSIAFPPPSVLKDTFLTLPKSSLDTVSLSSAGISQTDSRVWALKKYI